MAKTMQPLHEIVAAKLIAQLAQGTAPWQKPWEPGPSATLLPMNPLTGKRYRGINAIQLMSEGHADPRWMTYKQAASIGVQVRRGEKGTPIQYWKLSEERVRTNVQGLPVRDAQGQPVREAVQLERPRVFLATVFNASQIDGLPSLPPRPDPAWHMLECPERILQASGATIRHAAHSGAYYRPSTDTIHLPDKAQVPSAAHYYATALHELGHWTGHGARLDRDLAHPFGSEGYAREELRAEIASMILGGALGIGHDPGQHAAYIGSWIRLLQRDPLELFRAAADAEKIQNFVLGLEQIQTLQQSGEQKSLRDTVQEQPLRQPTAEAAMQVDDHLANPVVGSPSGHIDAKAPPDQIGTDTALANTARSDGGLPSLHHPDDIDSGVSADAGPERVRQIEPAVPIAQRRERMFIAVPFKEHEQAKALGARWDRGQQSRYVPANVARAPSARWEPASFVMATDGNETAWTIRDPVPDQVSTSGRIYLAVPYVERHLAKAAGATWDKIAKSWYVGPYADMPKLGQWRLENVMHRQKPALQPRDEFEAAMRAHGLIVSGEHPIMDGMKHRVPVQGGKRGALDGFYVGHLDGRPAGRIINFKTGADFTWHSKGYVLSREQTAALVAQARIRLAAREGEHSRRQERTAHWIREQVAELVPLQQPTPYLQRKGMGLHSGVLTDREGRTTVIPGMDAEGKLWTMQTIYEDGTKRFAKDSRKEGCFHVIGGMQGLMHSPALVISEGYATASSVSQALGFATIAAFDASNLISVAKALKAKFPGKPVVIAGDDDRHLALTHGENRGRVRAEEAAAATRGYLLLPVFAPGEGCYPADLASVTPEAYRTHLRTGSTLTEAQLAALERMKQHKDFNDLATKSVLGTDAIGRQTRAFVSKVLGQRHARVEQAGQLSQSANGDLAQHPRQHCAFKAG